MNTLTAGLVSRELRVGTEPHFLILTRFMERVRSTSRKRNTVRSYSSARCSTQNWRKKGEYNNLQEKSL
jgi:hypothetical protein